MPNTPSTNDPFAVADSVIEKVYPNIYKKKKGWWGKQRISNFGILRVAIADVVTTERKYKK